jgi:CRP-like cAMP-binding protein
MESTTATGPIALRPDRSSALHSTDLLGTIARAPKPAKPGPAGPDGDYWRALLGSTALGSAEVDALAAIALIRQVTQGDAVFARAECATSLVALMEGVVTLGFRTCDGTLRTERIVRGPAWLDLSSAWLDEHHAMDARASTPSVVVELPIEALQALLVRQPSLAKCFIRGLANEVQMLAVNTHELMHKDAPGRLAQWLMLRSEPAPGREGQGVVRLSERKRDVASQLAITPETLSRLMRSFTRQGVIEVAGYTVRVLNPQALAQLAQA